MTAGTLKSLVTHNLGLKMLALFAAFGLWFNIASEPELATIVSVPVDYRNYPRDLVISSKIVDSVDIEARGPASRLREMQETRVAATIDFTSVHAPGQRTFTLSTAEVRPPRGVTLVRVIPQQLRFDFERQIVARVPVDVTYSGVLPRGLAVRDATPDPQKLEITGPESHVIAIRTVLTDPFDLSRVTGDSEQELSAYVGDSEIRFTGVPRVKVKIRLKKIDKD
jgi:YbbR domain-containing protein